MECNYCGNKVKDNTIYCPNCGEKVDTKKKNTKKEEKSEVVVVDENKNTKTDQSSDYSFLWGLLGYFVPIVGLVLFLVWREEKPKDSKAAGIGALIRAVMMVIALVITIVLIFYSALFNV